MWRGPDCGIVAAMAERPWFERIGPGDLTELATDVGPVPMNVGAALLLDAVPSDDIAGLVASLARRLDEIPRLRQMLVDVPFGLGRPIWVDDPHFEIAAHLEHVPYGHSDERRGDPDELSALLDVLTAVVVRPLDRSRPLWRAAVVTGLSGGQVGIVIAFHHVLADGIGGLAVLRGLVDDPSSSAPEADPRALVRRPRPGPTRIQLFADSAAARAHSIAHLPRSAPRLWQAAAELGVARPALAPRCSLNVATGPRRRADLVQADLERVRRVARDHGATVNDVMLVVIAGALGALLRHRGERLAEIVVSVPITARVATTTTDLGNRTGVMPVRVPTSGSATARLARTAELTRAQKAGVRGASQSLVGPSFRLAAAVGLFRPMINRQRMVNTFLTNLSGPPRPLTLCGIPISRIVPLTVTAGNVSVAFAALSYAGALGVTVIRDPDLTPDSAVLIDAFGTELDGLGLR